MMRKLWPLQLSQTTKAMGLIEVMATLGISAIVVVGVAISMNVSKRTRTSLTAETDFRAILRGISFQMEGPSSSCTTIFLSRQDGFDQVIPITSTETKSLNLSYVTQYNTLTLDETTGLATQSGTLRNNLITPGESYRGLTISDVSVSLLSGPMPPKTAGVDHVASYLIGITVQASARDPVLGPQNFSNATNPFIYTVDVNAMGEISGCFAVHKAGSPGSGNRI